MAKILLDANFLIKAIQSPESKEKRQFIDYLRQPNVTIYITPLIYYEVLRGVNWGNDELYAQYETYLRGISNLNIDKSIADRATELFRFERNYRANNHETPKKIDKHNFDIMHFSTAKVYGLEIASNDEDVKTWEQLHSELIASK